MDKIDHRKTYYLVFDTETTNCLECPLMYDLGFAIIDKKGNIYYTESLVIADVYCGQPQLMETAYYKKKLPKYEKALKSGERKLVSLYEARRIFSEVCRKFSVRAVVAHNARFDYRSTQGTQRYITKSQFRYFLPYGIPVWDTLEMSKSVIAQKPTYQQFCKNRGYLTKNGRVKLTAEILFRFISGEENFLEEHQGLDDVLIEKEILTYCLRQHKKMKRSPWKELEVR